MHALLPPSPPQPYPTPEAIRTARQAAGLTQKAAAKLVCAAERSWQDWEGGRRKMHPVFWTLFQLKVLG